jgi:hypothetical protein
VVDDCGSQARVLQQADRVDDVQLGAYGRRQASRQASRQPDHRTRQTESEGAE